MSVLCEGGVSNKSESHLAAGEWMNYTNCNIFPSTVCGEGQIVSKGSVRGLHETVPVKNHGFKRILWECKRKYEGFFQFSVNLHLVGMLIFMDNKYTIYTFSANISENSILLLLNK